MFRLLAVGTHDSSGNHLPTAVANPRCVDQMVDSPAGSVGRASIAAERAPEAQMVAVSVHVDTEARRQLLATVRRDPARMARRWEPLSDATITAFDNWDRSGALQAALDTQPPNQT